MFRSELVFRLFERKIIAVVFTSRKVVIVCNCGDVICLDADCGICFPHLGDYVAMDFGNVNTVVAVAEDKFDQDGPFFDLFGRVFFGWFLPEAQFVVCCRIIANHELIVRIHTGMWNGHGGGKEGFGSVRGLFYGVPS